MGIMSGIFGIFSRKSDNSPQTENKKERVGCKAIPLLWTKTDRATGEERIKEVAIYGFVYNPEKNTIYGIRHWQGWEEIGYTAIPLKYLRLDDRYSYPEIGYLTRPDQVSYQEGGPKAPIVGWVYLPGREICAIVWDDAKQKFKTVRSQSLIDTNDPTLYYR